jgi:hypothetical protein
LIAQTPGYLDKAYHTDDRGPWSCAEPPPTLEDRSAEPRDYARSLCKRPPAIAPLLKVLDPLDRYQRVDNASQVYDDEARKKLFDKINRVAAGLGVEEARKAGEGRRAGG